MCSLCPAGYHDGTSEEDESSDDGEFSDAEEDINLKSFDDEQEVRDNRTQIQKKMVQVTSLCGLTLMSNNFVLPC